jgi:predicted nucleic acid-binding protein
MTDAWVVDASVAAKWVLAEPDSLAAARLQGARLVAPAFLDIECAAILWKAVRRAEIGPAEAMARQAVLGDAPVERLADALLLPGAMRIAVELGHPVHDCLYLEAARLTGYPLVTADRRLSRLQWSETRIVALESLT